MGTKIEVFTGSGSFQIDKPDLTLQLGDTGYNLIDIGMAKKMINSRNGK